MRMRKRRQRRHLVTGDMIAVQDDLLRPGTQLEVRTRWLSHVGRDLEAVYEPGGQGHIVNEFVETYVVILYALNPDWNL